MYGDHSVEMMVEAADRTLVPNHTALILFALMVFGYTLSSLWKGVAAPLLFFREEVILRNKHRELCARINAIPSSELARRGRLQREGLALKKKLDAVEMKHWRYSFSLTSFLFLNKVEEHRDGSERTPFGQWCSNRFSTSIADLADHVFLLFFYNFPTVCTYWMYFVPSILYVFTSGGFFRIVTHLPLYLRDSEGETMKGMPCPAWMWIIMCALSLNFVARVCGSP